MPIDLYMPAGCVLVAKGCSLALTVLTRHPLFLVQLYRRYGTRRMSSSHPIPMQQEVRPAPEAQGKASAKPGAFLECNVAGRSPDSDMSASQYSANSGSSRLIRLYPEEDPAQPLEPGTPSSESTMATQQLWDALQRGRATAYRVSFTWEYSCFAKFLCRMSHYGLSGIFVCIMWMRRGQYDSME